MNKPKRKQTCVIDIENNYGYQSGEGNGGKSETGKGNFNCMVTGEPLLVFSRLQGKQEQKYNVVHESHNVINQWYVNKVIF